MTTCGIETDKRQFKPHLTLGRLNNESKISTETFTQIKLPPMHFKVTEIKLFKSEMRGGGSIYTQIANYNFAST
ncbi:MAG: hypothetical protein LBL17_03640 [Coxiellaceae bacterium]|nr:hypothetical protein [Coxiellaceae bacterium]